jgi:electron transport complex protein RnfB
MSLGDDIDALLPQTQCTQCGYSGCRPYADAIAVSEAPINRCAPGGAAGIAALASLLGRPALPLDPAHGVEGPRMAALIDEARCIGCTLCIQACPTDAIVGAAKQMHTVLIAQCTGCELCLPPCPVDCIEMLPMAALAVRGSPAAREASQTPVAAHAGRWRVRYADRLSRLARERAERDHRLATKAQQMRAALDATDAGHDLERKRAAVRAAIARARARAAGLGRA